jgi:phosphoserine aminotransferase
MIWQGLGMTSDIVIPNDLLPADGRFGSGPSKVRPEAVGALVRAAPSYLGTSHRHEGVRSVVRRLRIGVRELFDLPDGYEVILGNGGTTVLWDALCFGLIWTRSRHAVFGEFSSKFAKCAALAPHLDEPEIVESEPGTHPDVWGESDADVLALTHNETSTGVAMPIRQGGFPGIVAVDATSGAGGLRVDPAEFDFYYFAPQKGFASDGGLWVAACSPAALEVIDRIGSAGRYIPPSLDLGIALENSRKDQTYNTPALATLFLMVEQIDWLLDNGGLDWAAGRCDVSADHLYSWAESHTVAEPFVKDPAQRSHVVGTVDFDDSVDAGAISRVLRANGIVDTEPYRKLGRNQLRIGMYPAVDPADVAQLTRCIDFVIDALT